MKESLFSVAEAAQHIDASIVGRPELAMRSVVADSRQATAGSLFVALPGERTDGHLHLSEALSNDGRAAVVSERFAHENGDRLRRMVAGARGAACIVPDPHRALLRLAKRHLKRFGSLVRIAITGSNGKTSLKELTASIFSRVSPIFRTAENRNSDIGVPLEIFRLQPDHRVGIFELGMNRRGEIDDLADVVRPDVALITNIGAAHVGRLGSIKEIALEKKAIFSRFDGSQTAFVFESTPYRELLLEGVRGKRCTYGEGSTPGYEWQRANGLHGSVIRWQGRDIRLALPGVWQVWNALGAISIAVHSGLSPESIVEGIERMRPIDGRLEVIKGRIVIMQDSYNASPESTIAALDLLRGLDHNGRKICLLGAMKELGDYSGYYHREVLRHALRCDFEELMVVGEEYRLALGAEPELMKGRCRLFADREEVGEFLSHFLQAGDIVLLKASRSVGLERLCKAIGQRYV